MKRWMLTIYGKVTRDIKWKTVDAETAEAAKSDYEAAHKWSEVRKVEEVTDTGDPPWD